MNLFVRVQNIQKRNSNLCMYSSSKKYVCNNIGKTNYVVAVCVFSVHVFFIEALFQMKTTDIMSDTIRVKFYFTYKMSSFGIIF